MKNLFWLLAFVSVLIFPVVSFAGSAQWTPVTTNVDGTTITDLAGYNFYNVTSGRVKVNSALIPPSACTSSLCTYTIPGTVVDGSKYVVTAVDTSGNESGDSNQAIATIFPSAPGGLVIKIP